MSVLVLGATSRIAHELALRYGEAGQAVAVAARDLEEALRIAADVRVRTTAPCEAFRFDALAFETHEALVSAVAERLGEIEVAVLAFGDMGEQASSQSDFAAAHRVIDSNYTGCVSMCEHLVSGMLQQKRGAIVGITSVAGERGRQSNYIYGSAKGAFTLYLQGLRNRLFKSGLTVTTIKLGFVDTRMTFGMKTGIPIASPEDASRAIFESQARGADVVYYPWFWAGIMGIIRAIPEAAFKRLSL